MHTRLLSYVALLSKVSSSTPGHQDIPTFDVHQDVPTISAVHQDIPTFDELPWTHHNDLCDSVYQQTLVPYCPRPTLEREYAP